jgi:CarD family transcriptional regulator
MPREVDGKLLEDGDGAVGAPVVEEVESSLSEQLAEVTFEVGDLVVYPAQGVARVEEIRRILISGSLRSFYVLKILKTDRKVMVPVDTMQYVGVRPLLSEEQLGEVFALLAERTLSGQPAVAWHRRYKNFIDKISSGSPYDLAEVFRDLHRQSREKQLSYGEKQVLNKARALLSREISLVSSQTEDEVGRQLDSVVGE